MEVSSGDWAWTKKIQNSNHDDKRGLKAPATTRYVNLLKEVREGDIILSYLTKSLTQNSKWRGSIVGISTATSSCYKKGNTLFVDTDKDLEIPVPIKHSEFKDSKRLSEGFKKIIRRSMQIYLFEITKEDFEILIGMNSVNATFLKQSDYANTVSDVHDST